MDSINNMLPITSSVYSKLNNKYQKGKFVHLTTDSIPSHVCKGAGNLARGSLYGVALLVVTIASPLFLLADAVYKIVRSLMNKKINGAFVKDSHYIYESKVFDAYYTQLQSFANKKLGYALKISQSELACLVSGKVGANGAFQEKALVLLETILNKQVLWTQDEKRAFHENTLSLLREIITLKNSQTPQDAATPLNQEIGNFVDDLCLWMYSEVDLNPQIEDFIETHKKNKKACAGNTAQAIDDVYQSFTNNPEFPGIYEPKEGRVYDPHYLGDLPSVLFTIPTSDEKSTKVIRTPNVTRDGSRENGTVGALKTSIIVEEYRNMVESLQRQGEKILYVNLMNRTNNHSEIIRSKAIEALEDDKNCDKAALIVTLDKDSDFYWQGTRNLLNQFQTDETFHPSEAFVSNFNSHLGSNCFHWPKALNQEEWKKECAGIVNDVHVNYFGSKASLTRVERLDFIEVTYSKLIHALLQKYEPKLMVEVCKSHIDRGPTTTSLQYIENESSKTAGKLEEAQIKKSAVLANAFAPLAQARPADQKRVERLKSASEVITRGDSLAPLKQEISAYIDHKSAKASKNGEKLVVEPSKRAEYISKVANKYMLSKDVYAPVVIKWVNYLLEKANAQNKKLVFMARDGNTPFTVAKQLMATEEYKRKYPNLDGDDKMVLGYFSRKLVGKYYENKNGERNDFVEYVHNELGVKDGQCIWVDTGMSGTMVPKIREMLNAPGINFEFLYATTDRSTGFIMNHNKDSWIPSIMLPPGAPLRSVWWMEDSHQGTVDSPVSLTRLEDGHLVPTSIIPGKKQTCKANPLEYLVKKFCFKAVIDSSFLNPDSFTKDEAKAKLERTLEKLNNQEILLDIEHKAGAIEGAVS